MVVLGLFDGLVNVFDINVDNEEDVLVIICNLVLLVSCIGWFGKGYKQIYCMIYDEGFYWWDFNYLDIDELVICLNIQDVREVVNMKEDFLDYLIGGLYYEKIDILYVIGGINIGRIYLMNCSMLGLIYVISFQGGYVVIVCFFCWNV